MRPTTQSEESRSSRPMAFFEPQSPRLAWPPLFRQFPISTVRADTQPRTATQSLSEPAPMVDSWVESGPDEATVAQHPEARHHARHYARHYTWRDWRRRSGLACRLSILLLPELLLLLCPLAGISLHYAIRRRTREAFGAPIPPHWFRDATVTMLVRDAPASARLTSSVLGHASPEMANRHYNQALMIESGRRHARLIESLIDAPSPPSRKAGRLRACAP